MLIRRSQHNLNYLTNKKKILLEDFFVEYASVVNQYIQLFWKMEKVPSNPTSDVRLVETWLLGKAQKCAYRQAAQIVKSAKTHNKKKIYKSYQKIFAKAKKKKPNWAISTQKWKEWSQNKTFRDRIKIPVFDGNSINLNLEVAKIYQQPNKLKHFDLVVSLSSIFGNRFRLWMPTKKHRHFNKKLLDGFTLGTGVQLIKKPTGYFLNIFFEKEQQHTKAYGSIVGIDVGIKKLMSLSTGEFFGTEFDELIAKRNRRVQGSKNHKQTIIEIKQYISRQIKLLGLEYIRGFILENLKVSKMIERNNKNNKTLRKKLTGWNYNLLLNRLVNYCDENRVFVEFINPKFTSQQCSSCQNIDKESLSKHR